MTIKYWIHQRPMSIKIKKSLMFDVNIDDISLEDYVCTYRGELFEEIDGEFFEATDEHILDILFAEFNLRHPENFGSYSVSVGDIIKLNNKYYLCQSIGWCKLNKKKLFGIEE